MTGLDLTAPLSVESALEWSRQRTGLPVYVTGLLTWAFENQSLAHWPKSEAAGCGFWLEAAAPAFGFDADVLRRWSGKRVVVGGRIERPAAQTPGDGIVAPPLDGCGHLGAWPAQIRVTSLVLHKTWLRNHP